MNKIYINESQLNAIREADKEITFYEFVINIKNFLKDLLKKPNEAEPSDILTRNGLSKGELIDKMKDIGLIKSSERIDEVPVEESDKHPYGEKMVAKRYITYKIPKSRFSEKVRELYKDLIQVNEDDGASMGATSCGSVMQGGGDNPSAGQYDVPFGQVQRRGFWKDAMSRGKDKKNKSISVNNAD